MLIEFIQWGTICTLWISILILAFWIDSLEAWCAELQERVELDDEDEDET